MQILSNCTHDEINQAAKALKNGQLVAFPTETVYGLGADANNEMAIRRIYEVKGRPNYHPLIVHIPCVGDLNKWAVKVPAYAKNLAIAFWPGPMTLILARSKLANNFITGGQDYVGIRVPSHPVSHALLTAFQKIGGNGIAAPSANRFGAVSPTTAQAVEEELAKFLGIEDLVLDNGKCEIGVESSIINCTQDNPVMLRPGAITKEMIEEVTRLPVSFKTHENMIRASGLIGAHYSPKAEVFLGLPVRPGDGFIALDQVPTPIGSIRLASPASIEDYARDLYEALRMGDQRGLNRICVLEPQGPGLAIAIRDRLARAASGNST